MGRLSTLSSTATITSSKSLAERSIMSRWPIVIGSNDPGYIARRVTLILLKMIKKQDSFKVRHTSIQQLPVASGQFAQAPPQSVGNHQERLWDRRVIKQLLHQAIASTLLPSQFASPGLRLRLSTLTAPWACLREHQNQMKARASGPRLLRARSRQWPE